MFPHGEDSGNPHQSVYQSPQQRDVDLVQDSQTNLFSHGDAQEPYDGDGEKGQGIKPLLYPYDQIDGGCQSEDKLEIGGVLLLSLGRGKKIHRQ